MSEKDTPLSGEALIKEVCRRIRVARSYWDAHNNAACRHERDREIATLQHIDAGAKRANPPSSEGLAPLPQ